MNKKCIINFTLSTAFIGANIFLASLSNNSFKTSATAASPTIISNITSITSIDLSDNSSGDIRAYYSDLNELSSSERKGTNLLKNLKPILSGDSKYLKYNDIWKAYEITDRNWDLSTPSDITYGTYDSTNEQYTDYEYSSSISSVKNNPYTHALYRNDNDNEDTALRNWDAHTSSDKGFTNREHVWPQSRGFKTKTSNGAEGPAGTDLHHLMSADGSVNQVFHNNFSYGNVDVIDSEVTSYYTDEPWTSDNARGTPKTVSEEDWKSESGISTVFEPQDCDKGDIARACFYMVARYNNYAGESGVISDYDPNLTLLSYVSDGSNNSYYSSDTTTVGLGNLKDLLEWHKLDPVDEYEIHRNNLIYNNYQNNRNPFVDFPSWVDIIWGDSEEAADPTTDAISKSITSISWDTNPTKTEYVVGEEFDSTGSVITAHYSDGTSENIASKCTFDYGTFVNAGEITVTATYLKLTATTTVTVTSGEITKTSYTWTASKNDFIVDTAQTNVSLGDDADNKFLWNIDGAGYFGSDGNNRGVQIGSTSKPVSTFELSTSSISQYKIKSITVNAATASKGNATLSIYVGDIDYLGAVSLTSGASDYSCSPNAYGDAITIKYTNSASKAVYFKSVTIEYNNDEYKAYLWAKSFNDSLSSVCNISGDTDFEDLQTSWNAQKTSYSGLTTDVKSYILNPSTTVKETYRVEINSAVNKYSFIVNKYTSLSDFLEKRSNSQITNIKEDTANNAVVIVISIMSLGLLISSINIIRKRKVK